MSELPAITRGTGVPPPNPRLHWVETVDANQKIRFRCWSPAIWEIWTHFNGRTRPCFENHDLCQGGHDESTLRWYGYVFGWHEARNGTGFLQLTTGAARLWLNQVASGCSLRGMIVTVSRGASKKGPMQLRVDQFVNTGQGNMGQDLDPLHSAFRLWKVNHLGQAYRLSLVSGPEDLDPTLSDDGCLKTDAGALSIKEGSSASRTKRRSNKRNTKREPA